MLLLLLNFLRNAFGSIHSPYTTYRRLDKEDPNQLLLIFTLIAAYFFLVSPIKLHTFHPFLLTLNTLRLFTASLATYLFVLGFLMLFGKVLKGKPSLRGILLSWGYSLLPTLIWFFTTSIFYVILPPPRHETWLGRLFSLLYVAFSLSLFFWKGLLYYLTLRFSLKFDLGKIIAVSVLFFPALMFYSLLMYRLGIFRVPFV